MTRCPRCPNNKPRRYLMCKECWAKLSKKERHNYEDLRRPRNGGNEQSLRIDTTPKKDKPKRKKKEQPANAKDRLQQTSAPKGRQKAAPRPVH